MNDPSQVAETESTPPTKGSILCINCDGNGKHGNLTWQTHFLFQVKSQIWMS